jgi:glycosyltransferase involved in cell wall biosynthesis
MNNPFLTISIPTYNRGFYLSQLLDSILDNQLLHLGVRVYVSDNASTDDTGIILDSFYKKFPALLTYNIANDNLGADANYLKCLTVPSSKYIWLFGSDDLTSPDAISTVVKLLHANLDSDIHLFSRLNFYKSIDETTLQHFCAASSLDKSFSIADKPNTIRYTLLLKNSRDIAISFSYITSCIVSSAKVKLFLSEQHPIYLNSLYVHVEIFLSLLVNGSTLRVYSYAPILNRCNNDSFAGKDRSKRRMVDYGLKQIAKHVFRNEKYIYNEYIRLLGRQFLPPRIAIGDLSRAFRDGGLSSLKDLNSSRNFTFAELPVLRYLSKFYEFFLPPWFLKVLFKINKLLLFP